MEAPTMATGHMHLKPTPEVGIWEGIRQRIFGSRNKQSQIDADVEDFFYITRDTPGGQKLHLVHHSTIFLPDTAPQEVSKPSRSWTSFVPWWLGGNRLEQWQHSSLAAPKPSLAPSLSNLAQKATQSAASVVQRATPSLESVAENVGESFEQLTERIKHELSTGAEQATDAAGHAFSTASSVFTRATTAAEDAAEGAYSRVGDAFQSAQQFAENLAGNAENLASRSWQRRLSFSDRPTVAAPASLLLGSLFALYLVLLRRRIWNLRKRTSAWIGDGQIEMAQQELPSEIIREPLASPPTTPAKLATPEPHVVKTTVKYRRYNDLARALEGVHQLNHVAIPLILLALSELMGMSRVLTFVVATMLFVGSWFSIELDVGSQDKTVNRTIGHNLVNLATTISAVFAGLEGFRMLL